MTIQSRLDSSGIHLLHRVSQCAGEIFTAEVGEDGPTPRQFAILWTLAENEGVSQSSLVERTGIDRSTLADVVRRMMKKGLVQRKRTKEDARAYAVRLSDKGRQVLKAATPSAAYADERLLAGLSAAQRKQFLDTLNQIVRSVAEASTAAKPKRSMGR